MLSFPQIAYGTPRRLPRASQLKGRVVVLDVAFASEAGGAGFERITQRFIVDLGDRLAMWIDHHDHDYHARYADDPRFVLAKKSEHGACPEMVTPALVAKAGPVDTICCHVDFDGLCSAAKWIRQGQEPYPGADDDARAIDTRMGKPSDLALVMDRALRALPRDNGLKGIIIRYLAEGCQDRGLFATIKQASDRVLPLEQEARALAKTYKVQGDVAFADVRGHRKAFDKTLLLLLGQELARVAVVCDDAAVTAAARFDSGVNLLRVLGLSGGMPTRVSVAPQQLESTLKLLHQAFP